jgi:cell division protein ZapA
VKRPITIHIAGQRYLVKSDADESYVQSLANHVNARVNSLKGTRLIATQSDVVLAALQLADELSREKQQKKDLKLRICERSQKMLDYLDQLADGRDPERQGP